MSEKVITTGFVCGTFDLLHPGHVHLLLHAYSQCDKLTVGLHSDPTIDRPHQKNKPTQTLFERYFQLSALPQVFDIIPYDTEKDLENILSIYNFHKRFLGSDYEGKFYTAKEICEQRGIELVYIQRTHSWSSTELKARFQPKTDSQYNDCEFI